MKLGCPSKGKLLGSSRNLLISSRFDRLQPNLVRQSARRWSQRSGRRFSWSTTWSIEPWQSRSFRVRDLWLLQGRSPHNSQKLEAPVEVQFRMGAPRETRTNPITVQIQALAPLDKLLQLRRATVQITTPAPRDPTPEKTRTPELPEPYTTILTCEFVNRGSSSPVRRTLDQK